MCLDFLMHPTRGERNLKGGPLLPGLAFDASERRMLRWLSSGHNEEATSLQLRPSGTEIEPAQLLQLADQRHTSTGQAVELVQLTNLLDGLGAYTNFLSAPPATSDSSRARSQRIEKLRSLATQYNDHVTSLASGTLGSWDRSSVIAKRSDLQFSRLSDAIAALPVALKSMHLVRAMQLIDVIDDATVRITAGGLSSNLKTEASELRLQARASFQAERQLREASAVADVMELHWLSPSSDLRGPTANEMQSIRGLLEFYEVPPRYIDDFARTVWFDIRQQAGRESTRFRVELQPPIEVIRGEQTVEAFVERIKSTQNYAEYLKTDPLSYGRVVSEHLAPKREYDKLSAQANNGGVLRSAQLDTIFKERDVIRQDKLAGLAYRNFRFWIQRDWPAPSANPNRPVYGDFARALKTPEGLALFGGIQRNDRVQVAPQELLFQAKTLDFLGQMERRLGFVSGPVTTNRLALRQAKAELEQEMRLYVPLAPQLQSTREAELNLEARALFGELLRRIDTALQRPENR
jgi:hypothetical protein